MNHVATCIYRIMIHSLPYRKSLNVWIELNINVQICCSPELRYMYIHMSPAWYTIYVAFHLDCFFARQFFIRAINILFAVDNVSCFSTPLLNKYKWVFQCHVRTLLIKTPAKHFKLVLIFFRIGVIQILMNVWFEYYNIKFTFEFASNLYLIALWIKFVTYIPVCTCSLKSNAVGRDRIYRIAPGIFGFWLRN